MCFLLLRIVVSTRQDRMFIYVSPIIGCGLGPCINVIPRCFCEPCMRRLMQHWKSSVNITFNKSPGLQQSVLNVGKLEMGVWASFFSTNCIIQHSFEIGPLFPLDLFEGGDLGAVLIIIHTS